ncbi:hypothetical protein BRW84_08585 [Oxalobacter formigenes OXCC13]|nr:hypothetical protein BRW84_08585 [Oxalobacter formigenes OXCC13]
MTGFPLCPDRNLLKDKNHVEPVNFRHDFPVFLFFGNFFRFLKKTWQCSGLFQFDYLTTYFLMFMPILLPF